MNINISIIGLPGSGKGTQVKIINKLLKNFSYIYVGDVIRKIISVKQGDLIEDEIIEKIITEEIAKKDNKNIIIEGAPRSLNQCKIMYKHNILDQVIEIQTKKETCIKRIVGRRIHVPSGRIYNDFYYPPKNKYYDDITQEPLEKREDDTKETAEKRILIYEKHIKSIKDFCKENKIKFTAINGNQDIQDISKDIIKAINESKPL